jgi:hypothetical protein
MLNLLLVACTRVSDPGGGLDATRPVDADSGFDVPIPSDTGETPPVLNSWGCGDRS